MDLSQHFRVTDTEITLITNSPDICHASLTPLLDLEARNINRYFARILVMELYPEELDCKLLLQFQFPKYLCICKQAEKLALQLPIEKLNYLFLISSFINSAYMNKSELIKKLILKIPKENLNPSDLKKTLSSRNYDAREIAEELLEWHFSETNTM